MTFMRGEENLDDEVQDINERWVREKCMGKVEIKIV